MCGVTSSLISFNERTLSLAIVPQESEQAELDKAVRNIRAAVQKLNYEEQREIDLAQEQDKRMREHSQLSKREEEISSSVAGFDFKYSEPERGFDSRRVKGTVAANIRIRDAVNAPALEAVAGARLHHVIVDNEKTGMLLLTKGRLQRRVVLIPLNKIRCDVVIDESSGAIHPRY